MRRYSVEINLKESAIETSIIFKTSELAIDLVDIVLNIEARSYINRSLDIIALRRERHATIEDKD